MSTASLGWLHNLPPQICSVIWGAVPFFLAIVPLAELTSRVKKGQVQAVEWTEFRKYPRIKVNFPVECELAGGTFRARAVTLGGGGLSLRMAQEIALGTELVIRFRPAKHLPFIEARAKVCRSISSQETGIEFTEMKPEDRQKILRLLLHRMGEKRIYPRKVLVVQVEHETGAFLGFSRNISVGGMFIEVTEPLTEGSRLTLRFNLDDGGSIVVATADVRYAVQKLGIGVQFVHLSAADRSRIDVYVTKGQAAK